MINWKEGRQGTGYFNYKVASNTRFLFDIYLVKFPVGCCLPAHVDEVETGKHYRVNIILWPALKGGKFRCENCIVDLPFLKIFRPDVNEHEVTLIEKGTRYILSFGFIL